MKPTIKYKTRPTRHVLCQNHIFTFPNQPAAGWWHNGVMQLGVSDRGVSVDPDISKARNGFQKCGYFSIMHAFVMQGKMSARLLPLATTKGIARLIWW